MRRVALIIPAFNEGERISRVLRAVILSNIPDEVIVVSDGSTDDTVIVAQSFPGVRVIDLPENIGKGGAMAAAVAETQAEILIFVDADLSGLNPTHLDAIVKPIRAGTAEMTIGVFRGGKFWSDTAQWVAPQISGQRAMLREIFTNVSDPDSLRLGIEIALTNSAHQMRARILKVVLRGVSHAHKESKLGLISGTAARAKMYLEIGQAIVRAKPRGRVKIVKPWAKKWPRTR